MWGRVGKWVGKHKFLVVGMACVFVFWIGESFLHFLIFSDTAGLFNAVLPGDANELWMRALACLLFIGFGLYVDVSMGTIWQQRERLRITLASIGDAVLVTDAEGRCVSLNGVAEALTGWDQKEAQGRALEDFFKLSQEATGRAAESPVAQVLREGQTVRLGAQTLLTARDGTRRHIEASAAPIRDEQGNVSGAILVFRDVTERRQAERRLAGEHAVSQILAVSSSLNEATPDILRAICESLHWDMGTLWVVDRKANLLRSVASWHRPEAEVPAFEQDAPEHALTPGVGLPGRVWASQSLIWLPDGIGDANFPRTPVAAKEGLHEAVAFPIQNGVECLGVMEFSSRRIRPPDEALLQMMTSIGNQISQFIEWREAESELRKQEADRRIARQIQQGLLPKAMPTFAGFQISGRSAPAQDVGGDCFDFIPLRVDNEECLGILVADASGHGIGAALLVGQTRAYLRALALTCADVGTLLTLSNQRLASDLVADHFVTLFLMRLDPRTRSLHYTSAGHWPGYVLDRQGRAKAVLASTGGPLGIDTANEFPTGPLTTLEPGELVFLFTDGIVEAASPDGEQFGLKRTLGIVRAHQHETPDEILDALFDAVSDFSGHQLQDDITAVILKAEGVT